MATQTRNSSRSGVTKSTTGAPDDDRVQRAIGHAADAVGQVGDEMPAMIGTANRLLADSAQRLAESPDDVLRSGAAAATGFALGLYLAGAPRFLVSLAMIPVIAIGLTLVSRPARTSRAGSPGTR